MEGDYYRSRGGQVPVRWTAPEVSSCCPRGLAHPQHLVLASCVVLCCESPHCLSTSLSTSLSASLSTSLSTYRPLSLPLSLSTSLSTSLRVCPASACQTHSLDVRLTAPMASAQNRIAGHSNVVRLHASDVRPCGHHAEVLMLMEYCPGGHVVDIMNRRLKQPFTESEVLKVRCSASFSARACSLQPHSFFHFLFCALPHLAH